jgi:hypothetical protein
MKARWLIAVALLFIMSLPLQAEVGVFEIEFKGPYILGIIDDPDPTSKVWRRYSPAGAPGRVVLNEQGEANGDGDPAVLFNTETGTPIVAWARNSAEGFDIVLSHLVDGAWSTPQVLAGDSYDELDPFLALDEATGAVHLLYWVNDATPKIVHRQAPADLSSWSAPRIVSGPAEIAARPAAKISGGTLRVVYESHNGTLEGTPKLIVLATDSGSGFVFETLGSSLHAAPNRPQIHNRPGRAWVEWIDGAGEMSWTREGSGGGWDPLDDEPYAGAEERDYFVRGRIRAQATE